MQEELFSIVHSVSNIISQASDSKKTLQSICKYLAEQVNAKFVVICLYDPLEARLAVRAVHGVYLVELENYHPEEQLSIKAFRESRIVNVSHLAKYVSSDNKLLNSVAQRVNSILAIPLRLNKRTIGTITLGRSSRQAFPMRLVSLMEIIASTLAMYIANSNLAKSAPRELAVNNAQETAANGFVQHLSGRPIVQGICTGQAEILLDDDILRNQKIDMTQDPQAESSLLDKAYSAARASIQKTILEINNMLTEADSSIFEMHAMLLEDPTLRQRIIKYINMGYTLETSLCQTFREFEIEYQKIEDEYLRERLRDIEDVLLRLMNGARNAEHADDDGRKGERNKKIILVAKELLPSQLISSPLRQVCGIVCETGGATSHAAILARALRIPMLGGVSGVQDKIRHGDNILLDCHAGVCYVRPTIALLQQFRYPLSMDRKMRRAATLQTAGEARPIDETPLTADGTRIRLQGNITLFSELPMLHNAGIASIGLYRTEFMFMIRNSMPDEEEQFHVLCKLVKEANGASVTIRALDIGGDKPLPYVKWDEELNPSLGWRGLRFLLSNPDFLIPHLKAILRTTMFGNVQVMFPMVADKIDLFSARKMLLEAEALLKHDGIPFKHPKFGMMLEVPSAILDLENMLPEVDFVSVGTNDLIQYLFAVDRGNSHVNKWFRQFHPTVLKALSRICGIMANHPEKTLSICGELGGNAKALPLLLGIGLRQFSMNSIAIPTIRDYIPKLSIGECSRLASEAMACESDQEVTDLLNRFSVSKGLRIKNI